MTTFFTSDNHFGHENIIGYTGRKYSSMIDMDVGMAEAWNAKVGPKDEVYILGDFCFNEFYFKLLHNYLNGHKFYVLGNHDPRKWRGENGAQRMRAYLPGSTVLVGEGHTVRRFKHKFFVSHRPFASWPWDAIHLHGHLHGGKSMHVNEDYSTTYRRVDVGVDAWDGAPVSMEEILKHVEKGFMYEGRGMWNAWDWQDDFGQAAGRDLRYW